MVEHSDAFVDLLPAAGAVVDLGSGGGRPGLVIAARCVDLDVHLVDRAERRASFLAQTVRALGWSARVSVHNRDARVVGRDPFRRATAAAVTARGFGPPLV